MAGKPDTRELAHEAIGSARLTAFGVSNVAPAGAVAGGLVIVVAYAGLRFVTAAVNAIIRILFAMGRERVLPRSLSRLSRHSAPGSAIISGSAAICSYRRRPLFSCCFPSGDSSPARPYPDGPAALRGAGMALPGRYRRQHPADPPAGRITRARVTTFHNGPTGWSHEFRRF